jgi:hypothetical protein
LRLSKLEEAINSIAVSLDNVSPAPTGLAEMLISKRRRFAQCLAIFLRDNWIVFEINFATTRNCEPVARNFQQYDY